MADKNTSLAKINSNLDVIRSSVYKFNIHNLENSYTVADFDTYNTFKVKEESAAEAKTFERVTRGNIGAVRIKSWVYDEKEDIVERFKNIYNSFMNSGESIAMVIKRLCTGAEFYFVFKNDSMYSGGGHKAAEEGINKLEATIKGNFPGTVTEKFHDDPLDIAGLNDKKVVSVITNIASEKSEKFKSQGIEKLLNGIVPSNVNEEYSIVILAESISYESLMDIKNGYEEIASNISEFKEWQITESTGKNENWGDGSCLSNTHGTNSSISKTNGFSINGEANLSKSLNIGKNITEGWALKLIKKLRHPIKQSDPMLGSKQNGASLALGYQRSTTHEEGKSESTAVSYNSNHCIGTEKSSGEMRTYTSYPIKNLLERIEKQIKRLDECEAVGAWKEAAYIFAHNSLEANKVASYYIGLMQGDESFTETATINTWSDDNENNSIFKGIRKYICHFTHPVFLNINDINVIKNNNDGSNISFTDFESLTPTTYLSSSELASMMAFPHSSVLGFTCIKCASFERNIYEKNSEKTDKKIELGHIYHMHSKENSKVYLNANSLTRHTFITGSTGSGKSTTIYKILREAYNVHKIPFLVVEPAKGEYKKEFNDIEDVKIYSTNFRDATLLSINPFSFPSDTVLVNEHIDRLIEIFNACWPMYAAMPAVLKDAMEKAYEAAGWDLMQSENKYGNDIFPDFQELINQLLITVNNSEYSEETKGNYKGSLVTRVQSLTNGINGVVFSRDELNFNEIMKHPTIIDLSKVGSLETKSLIMGIIVMKMQEYYFDKNSQNGIKHITVLEEAHNLLKRTSEEQNIEGANLIGKSVEMIANAIAEMRTYGEGFIIADQSPGKMDLSVIRNTNTKIIMSLPDYSDRELVGKAINLNDEQIDEIPRLGQGIGVVYQNEWIAPVLCSVEMAEKTSTKNGNSKSSNEYGKNFKAQNLEKINKRKKTSSRVIQALFNKNHKNLDNIDGITEKDILDLNIALNYKLMLIEDLNKKAKLLPPQKKDIIHALCFNEEMKEFFYEIEKDNSIPENNEQTDEICKKWRLLLCKNIEATNISKKIVLEIFRIVIRHLHTFDDKELSNCEKFYNQMKERGW